MRKIHVTQQFFEASGLHGDLIEKTKKKRFRYGQWEYVCQISGLYRFRFARRRDTHK